MLIDEAFDGRVCCVATQYNTEAAIDFICGQCLPTVCKVIPSQLLLENELFFEYSCLIQELFWLFNNNV